MQGTASDFCLASIIDVVQWIKDDCVPAKLVLTVHDSIMLEVDDDAVEEVAYQCKRIMESHNSCGIPLEVDVEIGQSWGSLESYEVEE